MGVLNRRRGSRRADHGRARRPRTIVATIVALDEDQVLFCSCAAGCDDCEG